MTLIDPAQLTAEAFALLAKFLDPAQAVGREQLIRTLAPRAEDYTRVFVADMADSARNGYSKLWLGQPAIVAKPPQTSILISAAEPADFLAKNEASQKFPGGYLEIAAHLVPGVTWMAWKFVVPGERVGMAYDGLVRLDDRFVWFPKPWKVITQGPSPLSHFAN